MNILTEKVRIIVDPSITDSASTFSARSWLNQNIDSISKNLVGRDENYAIAKIVLGVSAFDTDLEWRLGERLRDIERLGSAPATREVLESLYVAYDIGTVVVRLSKSLLRTDSAQVEQLHGSLSLAERLIKAVNEKSSMIKRSLDEGGWIDKVLKSVFQGDPDVDNNTTSIPGTLKSIVDENFMEEWAGQVVDSWKDSVKGFAYFKP
jgi:N-terminal acetyltransferase B complex non-catalytic subunit